MNYLSVQANKRGKGNLIIMVYFICLKEGLLNELMFPSLESGCASTKDSVVSLLPYEPGTQHEVLDEERFVELALGFLHHLVKRETEVPDYA
jgi:hypothetical protein